MAAASSILNDSNLFINSFINNINNIREEEFMKYKFTYEEIEIKKKQPNDNLMEFRNFKSELIKRANIDKSKPANINRGIIEVDTSGVNILEDDIFQNDEEKQEEIKINIDTLTIEDKKKLIEEYLKRKNINLEEYQINKIDELLNNVEFNFKKHITISKVDCSISKIGFLKKGEDGNYFIDLRDKQKSKNIFFK